MNTPLPPGPQRDGQPAKGTRAPVGLRVGRNSAEPDEVVVSAQAVVSAPAPGTGLSRTLGDRVARVTGAVGAVGALGRLDWLVLGGLLVVAALLRLPGLDARGQFAFDQGTQLLALAGFHDHGVIPLLGPRTSVGEFHHGAWSYYLLLPPVLLAGPDPNAIVGEIALFGIAAVAAVWWAGSTIGGRGVGAIAALLAAVSPAGVINSTFIWNPNPIDLFAAISIGAAWKAHLTASWRWWTVAIAGAFIVGQLQIVELTFVPIILGLLAWDLRAAIRAGDGARRRAALRGLAVGTLAALVINAPLLLSELQTGFAETRGIVAYVAGGAGEQADLGLRLAVISLRVSGWPYLGIIIDAPLAASLEAAAFYALVAWNGLRGRWPSRLAARWLLGSVAWGIVSLAIAAPSLAFVTVGLPNDHYHAFLDPIVHIGLATALVSLVRAAPGARADVGARIVVAAALALQVGVAIAREPAPDPNGGWPSVQAAGARIVDVVGATPTYYGAIPVKEPADEIEFGALRAGGVVAPTPGARYAVIACDWLFVVNLPDECGGPAEGHYLPLALGERATHATLLQRFEASPRTVVSIYDLGS